MKLLKERLRLGTPELIRRLQDEGFEVWVIHFKNRYVSEDIRFFVKS